MIITISQEDPRPIYQQLVDQAKEQILTGILKPGEELPPVRELAELLEVNLHTVRQGYRILKEEGLISMRLGQRARVLELRREAAGPELIRSRFAEPLRRVLTDGLALGLDDHGIREIFEQTMKELRG